ncbi:nicotinate-nucleotide--dimethylbenzimidazole phosphoribosyltransferase [Paraglaciecola sp. 20A4]|uniref:nicotinate-nucleotide--dimethylbenzimidazole phosphoribosyltransferase n=1 Tax=Paraglaciecola sp. 20A4 TaxID=2687288 RepID=UPI001F0D5DF1|nr:nicotinate-nucleotide--dimethylbenzimidazole phosphoribosyltransferase [Paraglaciecola sp. 20A4]
MSNTASLFEQGSWQIQSLNSELLPAIDKHIDDKTKPLGALGQLESLARQLALIQRSNNPENTNIEINKPAMLVFAGDHGIANNGISIAPPEVTQQMVLNFLSGGAAINCFCRTLGWTMKVIDAGICTPIGANIQSDDRYMLIEQRIGSGTADFSCQAAMSEGQAEQALALGAKVANKQISQGSNVLAFGEMGIGNTSSASALLSLICGLSPERTAGKGTGISDEQLAKKVQLISDALVRVNQFHGTKAFTPQTALTEVGGFEIAQIVGAILATAAAGKSILIDGFIVSVAALLAVRIAPRAQEYMLFAHCSAELAHQQVLAQLDARPLLSLGLRLGEGTGAALALPLLQAAASFYNDMATFESAGITV